METETRTTNPEAAATRLDALRERVEGEVREMVAEALEAEAAAEEEAERKVERFEAASAELEESRKRLHNLREELEALPLQAYTANMDGNLEEERRLRARYAELAEGKSGIPELEARIRELGRGTEAAYDDREARQRLASLTARREGLESSARRLPGTVDIGMERLRNLEREAEREAVETQARNEKPSTLRPLREDLGRLRRDLDGIVDEAVAELARRRR